MSSDDDSRDGRDSRTADRGLERLGDLLPDAARRLGLEDQFELAAAMSAWEKVIAERVPAASGSCRLVAFQQGVASVEADEPIVAQELRLRAPELLTALRATMTAPLRQLRVSVRHV